MSTGTVDLSGEPQKWLYSLTLTPTSVVAGEAVEGTVVLAGGVAKAVVDLVSTFPNEAPVPPQLTIEDLWYGSFIVATPAISRAFSPIHAEITASYSGESLSASLTVNPSVVAGLVKSLTLTPTVVSGGQASQATVTLVQAVPVDTVVTIGVVGGPLQPDSPPTAPVATAPTSITIRAGTTSGGFAVRTQRLPHGSPPTGVSVIVGTASGVASAVAGLTVKA